MSKTYFTYIMSNQLRRLYVGITSELQVRVFKHKRRWYEESFTARYCFDMLVFFEKYSSPGDAIAREKEIKGWRREKKLRLILAANPDWADLSSEWNEDESWRAIPEAKSRPLLRQRRGEP
jgi:putative endonuclease